MLLPRFLELDNDAKLRVFVLNVGYLFCSSIVFESGEEKHMGLYIITDGDVAKKPEIKAFSLWIHDQPSTRGSTHQTGAWTKNGPQAMWSLPYLPYFAPVIALRINLGDRMNVSNLTTMSPSMSGTNPEKNI